MNDDIVDYANSEDEYKKLLTAAIQKWGNEPQMLMVIEECAELIHAICKLLRGFRDGKDLAIPAANMLEEVVDVVIMTDQLQEWMKRNYVDCESAFDAMMNRKCARLAERLQK